MKELLQRLAISAATSFEPLYTSEEEIDVAAPPLGVGTLIGAVLH